MKQEDFDTLFQDEPYTYEIHDENNELYDYETHGQELFDNEAYLDDTEDDLI